MAAEMDGSDDARTSERETKVRNKSAGHAEREPQGAPCLCRLLSEVVDAWSNSIFGCSDESI